MRLRDGGARRLIPHAVGCGGDDVGWGCRGWLGRRCCPAPRLTREGRSPGPMRVVAGSPWSWGKGRATHLDRTSVGFSLQDQAGCLCWTWRTLARGRRPPGVSVMPSPPRPSRRRTGAGTVPAVCLTSRSMMVWSKVVLWSGPGARAGVFGVGGLVRPAQRGARRGREVRRCPRAGKRLRRKGIWAVRRRSRGRGRRGSSRRRSRRCGCRPAARPRTVNARTSWVPSSCGASAAAKSGASARVAATRACPVSQRCAATARWPR